MHETSGTPTGTTPTLLLMVGLPGAGKTTRARQLAHERHALRLTPDAWALTLFGADDRHQEPGGKRWLLEAQLIGLALDALRLGTNAILDFGLWSRNERNALRWMAESAGATSEIVYLPITQDVQWERIQTRWEQTPEQAFPMAREEVASWEAHFQIPDADELAGGAAPGPPVGEASWLSWAQQLWPTLTRNADGQISAR